MKDKAIAQNLMNRANFNFMDGTITTQNTDSSAGGSISSSSNTTNSNNNTTSKIIADQADALKKHASNAKKATSKVQKQSINKGLNWSDINSFGTIMSDQFKHFYQNIKVSPTRTDNIGGVLIDLVARLTFTRTADRTHTPSWTNSLCNTQFFSIAGEVQESINDTPGIFVCRPKRSDIANYNAIDNLKNLKGAFDGQGIATTIQSEMRTDTANYSTSVLINFAKAHGSAAYNFYGNVGLPLFKLILMYESIITDHSLCNAPAYVGNYFYSTIYRQPAYVSDYWPWCPDHVAARPVVNAAYCSVSYFSRMVCGAVNPPVGWYDFDNVAVVPMKTAWASGTAANHIWTLAYLQYPWRYQDWQPLVVDALGNDLGVFPSDVFQNNAASVYINGPRQKVLYVFVDSFRDLDITIHLNANILPPAANLANVAFAPVDIAASLDFLELSAQVYEVAIARWYQVFRCAVSEKDALYCAAEMIWRVPETPYIDSDGDVWGARFFEDATLGPVLSQLYASGEIKTAQWTTVGGSTNVSVNNTSPCGVTAEKALVNKERHILTHNIMDYDVIEGIMIASQLWLPSDTNVIQPSFTAMHTSLYLTAAKMTSWQDLLMEVWGVPASFYTSQALDRGPQMVYHFSQFYERIFGGWCSLRPVYATNLIYDNPYYTGGTDYASCGRIPICERYRFTNQGGLVVHDNMQYSVSYDTSRISFGGNNYTMFNHNKVLRSPIAIKEDRDMNSGWDTTLCNVTPRYQVAVSNTARRFYSYTWLTQMTMMVVDRQSAFAWQNGANIRRAFIGFLPVVSCPPRQTLDADIQKLYVCSQRALATGISDGRKGRLANGFIAQSADEVKNDSQVTSEDVDTDIFKLDF